MILLTSEPEARELLIAILLIMNDGIDNIGSHFVHFDEKLKILGRLWR